jgi:hypothetical protein
MWKTEQAPLPAGMAAGRLDDVAIARSGDAWAVGSTNDATGVHPLIEHWNGAAWTVEATDALPAGSGLERVATEGPDDAWAVGYIALPTGITPLVAHTASRGPRSRSPRTRARPGTVPG